MTATLSDLDSKIADLEAENEALKEERLILREKVKVSRREVVVGLFLNNNIHSAPSLQPLMCATIHRQTCQQKK